MKETIEQIEIRMINNALLKLVETSKRHRRFLVLLGRACLKR